MSKLLEVIDWRYKSYLESTKEQLKLVESRIRGDLPDVLIFTEHESIYTYGSKKDASSNLLWDKSTLKKNKVKLVKSNRGGDITYHGPGQLVVYPIIDLSKNKDLHLYLRNLEKVVIRVLKFYNIDSHTRSKKTGIWINKCKIASIGISVKSWVSYHGLSININPDLDYFNGIIQCGIKDAKATSVEKELEYSPDLNLLKERFIIEFKSIFYNYINK